MASSCRTPYSMLNWPGSHGSPAGSSAIVTDSSVSRRRLSTRAGRGVRKPGSAAAMGVHVQQLEPRGLQALQHQAAEALHQQMAELVVLVALPSQARAVEA